MAVTPVKVLLFVAGGAAAATATAYVSGALDPWLGLAPPQVAALAPAPAGTPSAKGDRLPGDALPVPSAAGEEPAAAAPAQQQPASPPAAAPAEKAPAADAATPARPAGPPTAPSFDIVRVEADGSMVVAGRAGPGTRVDVIAGANVIGSAAASGEGDFAVVLDKPLAPGDYQISLRSTGPGEAVASSAETAIVSVPQDPGGEVLAMIEEPGKPAELVSVPQASGGDSPRQAPAAAAAPAGQTQQPDSAEAAPSDAPRPAAAPAATAEPSASPAQPQAQPAAGQGVVVEAVEIEGRMVFVAGSAEPGRRVRAYAGDILLGDAVTSPAGRFLVEAERDLPVGDYVIRVDALDADGATVVARAAVPFEREPGEAIAAVAPAPGQSPSPAPTGVPDAGGAGPAAAAPAATAPAATGAPAAIAGAPSDSAAAVPVAPAIPAGSDAGQPTAVATAAPEIAAAPLAGASEQQPAQAQQVTAPKLQNVGGAVIIRRGDSLWRISRRVYGLGTRYSTIYLANQKQIRDPDLIWPGQVFKVPGKSKEGEDADMSTMGDQSTTLPAGETARQ